ncbi:MAG: glycosyltransferase family 2 protein [Anaerolineae bacterium]
MDLSIIIVNWNVKELLRDCLHAILAADVSFELEIIVVDSASTDGSAAMVEAEFPQARLIASSENLGFARGNNLGVSLARGRYFLLLNPDTRLEDEALAAMLSYMDRHPGVGVVGPQLRYPDNRVQSSRRRFPTPGSLFWESTLLGQWFPHNRHIRAYHLADQADDIPQAVDWITGAALFIRAAAWQQVGPIDEALFMYFEETDWCRRCARAGWAIHYLPAARVIHYEGKSSEQVPAARAIRFQRSKVYYTRKWFGWRWALALRLFLLLTFAWQLAEETGKWLVGHKRPLRRQRMDAYWQVLRSRLA